MSTQEVVTNAVAGSEVVVLKGLMQSTGLQLEQGQYATLRDICMGRTEGGWGGKGDGVKGEGGEGRGNGANEKGTGRREGEWNKEGKEKEGRM